MTQPTSSELKISNTSETIQHLYQTACESRLRSHSPYSGKKVGAALLTTDQKIYFGCNVENSTYGATCCAERTAVQMGVATQGKITIDLIVVVTDATPAWPPCGICRQVLAEFCKPQGDIKIIAANLEGTYYETSLNQIFLQPFLPTHLI